MALLLVTDTYVRELCLGCDGMLQLARYVASSHMSCCPESELCGKCLAMQNVCCSTQRHEDAVSAMQVALPLRKSQTGRVQPSALSWPLEAG